jgi:hypothetical protein
MKQEQQRLLIIIKQQQEPTITADRQTLDISPKYPNTYPATATAVVCCEKRDFSKSLFLHYSSISEKTVTCQLISFQKELNYWERNK